MENILENILKKRKQKGGQQLGKVQLTNFTKGDSLKRNYTKGGFLKRNSTQGDILKKNSTKGDFVKRHPTDREPSRKS